MDIPIKITLNNDKLYIQVQNGFLMEAKAISNNEFKINIDNDLIISFQKEEQGNEFYFTAYEGGNRRKCVKVGQ
jgi:hypothetical protein